MSKSQLTKVANTELRDLFAKLRFALVSIVLLPLLGATLTVLGVPRPIAAVVVFSGLAIIFLAFVVARVIESGHVTPEEYERQMIAEFLRKNSRAAAVAQAMRIVTVWRLTSRLAGLFVSAKGSAHIKLGL